MTEPASIRYKNPGAMWGGNAISKKWGEQGNVALNDGTGQGNHIAVFPTYVQGICAQIDLWRTARYKNKRFADGIAIWSGGNSVESYVSLVTKRVPGMTRNTIMNDEFWRGPMAIPFLKAQAFHEAGREYPAPDADWVEAQRRVFAGKPIIKSKIATGGGAVVATETVDVGIQINDALDKVTQAKAATDNLGLTDKIVETAKLLLTNPRFLVAVAIVLICVGIVYWRWRDHGWGR